LIAAYLARTCQITISPSQIGRILAGLDVKPHQVTGWLNRPADPAFFAQAAAICDLYLTLSDETLSCSASHRGRCQRSHVGVPNT
jgi:hypothetical protein